MITQIRVDDRLIHGQVAVVWTKELNAPLLVVANDEAKILAAQLTKVEVTVKVRMGEEGRVFGSVTAKDISDAAKAQYKVDIDKKKIEIKEPLKTLGVHDVLVRVHPEITSTIKVNVVAE